jgi:hypothetical protein
VKGSVLITSLIGAVAGLIGVVVGSWLTNQTLGIVSNIAALLAAMAAMLTAVGTFLTVRQMQRQMEASYRPELTFARVFVKGEAESPQCPLPMRWTEMPRFMEDWTGGGTTTAAVVTATLPLLITRTRLPTRLYNIGLGAATSISVTWSFPVEAMVEEINRLAQRTLTPAYYDYKEGILSLESQTWPKMSVFWRNEQKDSLDYIMPESAQKAGVALEIPGTYTHLVSAYLYLRFIQKDDKQELKMPRLNVLISYHDISGRRHQVSFNLCIHLIAMGTKQDSPMTFEGYIEAEKGPRSSALQPVPWS